MTSIAARLDPCVNWMKLLSRTHGRILWAFPAALVAAYLISVRWPDAAGNLGLRRSELETYAPLLAEARRSDLAFEGAVSAGSRVIGKPVVWCVSSNDGRYGFVDAKASMPVVWTHPSEDLKTNSGANGYCWKELAIVEGVDRGAVLLRPLEKL